MVGKLLVKQANRYAAIKVTLAMCGNSHWEYISLYVMVVTMQLQVYIIGKCILLIYF